MDTASASLRAELCEIEGRGLSAQALSRARSCSGLLVNPEGLHHTRGMVTGNPQLRAGNPTPGSEALNSEAHWKQSQCLPPGNNAMLLLSQPFPFKVIASISILCAHLGEVLGLCIVFVIFNLECNVY